MFIDSDDYIEPECIEIMMYNARVTKTDIIVANNKKLTDAVRIERRIEDKVLTAQEMRNPNWRFNYFIDPAYGITAWGKLYKHSFIKNTGIKFESSELIFSEDILFNCLLFTFNPTISLVNEYVYVYCINDGQITQSYRPRVSQRYVALLQIFCDQLTKLGRLAEYQDLMAFLCLRFISTCCYNEYKFSKNRYAAMKNHLTNLMQADIIKISIRNIAQGKFIDGMNKRNRKTTRLQASLLNHHLIDLAVILRMIRYKFR